MNDLLENKDVVEIYGKVFGGEKAFICIPLVPKTLEQLKGEATFYPYHSGGRNH